MRSLIITHTDWEGPDPKWIRQPLLPFRRDDRASWDKVFYDLGILGRVDCIAIGCRGTFDPPAVACLPIARDAFRAASKHLTATFWGDTVGLPDIAFNRSGGPFDFANPQHIRDSWDHFGWHFFKLWKDANLERIDGKVLIPLWGIASDTGHGFVNQQYAQRLLDSWDQQLIALGLGGAAFIVDKTWIEKVPGLKCYGVHDWFNPWSTPPQSYSIRTHNGTHGGITVGCVVPSYSDPNHPLPEKIPSLNGQTARIGLQACVAAGCHYAILEGATGFIEGIEWIRDSTKSTHNLNAIRELTGDPMPDPIEEPEVPAGAEMIGLVDMSEPNSPVVFYEALIPGKTAGTYALIVGRDAGRIRIASLRDTGEWSWRHLDDPDLHMPAEWESARKIGRQLVFRTGEKVKMFWIAAEGI